MRGIDAGIFMFHPVAKAVGPNNLAMPFDEMPTILRSDAVPGEYPHSDKIPALRVIVGRTKTTNDDEAFSVYLTKESVTWLKARITSGPVFRAVDQWGNMAQSALTPAGVNFIVKTRINEIDEDPADYRRKDSDRAA
ncbi:MAG: hypothetical protein ACJAVZ_002983 [Afipia broomeae]|jgi:hypothetical protein